MERDAEDSLMETLERQNQEAEDEVPTLNTNTEPYDQENPDEREEETPE